jgi:hypothetical protein
MLLGGIRKRAVGKVHNRPSVLDQFVEYLRDHLLLDRSVDVNHFYDGKSEPVCLEARKRYLGDCGLGITEDLEPSHSCSSRIWTASRTVLAITSS